MSPPFFVALRGGALMRFCPQTWTRATPTARLVMLPAQLCVCIYASGKRAGLSPVFCKPQFSAILSHTLLLSVSLYPSAHSPPSAALQKAAQQGQRRVVHILASYGAHLLYHVRLHNLRARVSATFGHRGRFLSPSLGTVRSL